ncbi:MAG: fibronectin type III domain-containing protein, partial [Gammaproteobacteria bacterium]
ARPVMRRLAAGFACAAMLGASAAHAQDIPVPTAPGNLMFAPTTGSESSLDFSWTESTVVDSSISFYVVHLREAGGSWGPFGQNNWPSSVTVTGVMLVGSEGLIVESGETFMRFTNLNLDTTYEVRIRAGDSDGGNGPWAEASATTAAGPPAAPDLAEPDDAHNSLILTWTAPTATGGAPITGYRVRWVIATVPPNVDYLNTGGAAGMDVGLVTTYTITGLMLFTDYNVEVAAVNIHGAGAWALWQFAQTFTSGVVCLDRAAITNYDACLAAAAAGYKLGNNPPTAQTVIATAMKLRTARLPVTTFTLKITQDAANPIAANTDIEGALGWEDMQIIIPDGAVAASIALPVTPKTSGDGGSLAVKFTVGNRFTSSEPDGVIGADNPELVSTNFALANGGIRITAATNGACPAAHNAALPEISLEEGGASGAACVSLFSAPAAAVNVACAARAGLLTAAPAMLAFSAANYNTAQAVTLRAVDNDISVPATAPTGALVCAAASTADSDYRGVSAALSVTITDTDAPDTVFSTGAVLSATSIRKNSNQVMRITATLGGNIAPAENCTVTLAFKSAAITGTRADRPAVVGADYQTFSLPAITIRAGALSGSTAINLFLPDTTDRQTASIPLSGMSTSCGGAANLAFADSEILLIDVRVLYSRAGADGACPATPTAELTSLTLVEGASEKMCVRLSADPAFDATAMDEFDTVSCFGVTFAALSPGDFPAFTTGAGGNWQRGQALTITATQDDISAGDKEDRISCGGGILDPADPRGFTPYGAFAQFGNLLVLTISEDDIVSTSGVLTAGFAGESGGAQMVRITATLNGTARPVADCAVTVTISTSAITGTRGGALAASPGDYTGALTAPALRIAAGELSGSAMLAITPVVDADELSESIPLAATAACGGAGSGGAHGSESVAFGSAEILIIDFNFAMLDGAEDVTYKDGILVARYLAGARGADLTAGLGLTDAAGVAVSAADSIRKNLPLLDVDGDAETTMADGILIARYFLGVTSGEGLYDGQVDSMQVQSVIDNITNNLSP